MPWLKPGSSSCVTALAGLGLSSFNFLTGLPNLRLLMDRLKQAIATSARTGKHGTLMFLDLDHFKLLNDTQGHDDQSVNDLMEKAALAMYQGKSTERNTARFLTPRCRPVWQSMMLARRTCAVVWPCRSVVAHTILARSLRPTVIAEAVETEGRHAFVADAGCNAFQRYYFGRLSPAEPSQGLGVVCYSIRSYTRIFFRGFRRIPVVSQSALNLVGCSAYR